MKEGDNETIRDSYPGYSYDEGKGNVDRFCG
jgi:hypothetical protein